jgi:hypothetical protein
VAWSKWPQGGNSGAWSGDHAAGPELGTDVAVEREAGSLGLAAVGSDFDLCWKIGTRAGAVIEGWQMVDTMG